MDHNLYTKYLEIKWINRETNTYKKKTLLQRNNTTQEHTIYSYLVARLALTLLSYSILSSTTTSHLPCSWMDAMAKEGVSIYRPRGIMVLR